MQGSFGQSLERQTLRAALGALRKCKRVTSIQKRAPPSTKTLHTKRNMLGIISLVRLQLQLHKNSRGPYFSHVPLFPMLKNRVNYSYTNNFLENWRGALLWPRDLFKNRYLLGFYSRNLPNKIRTFCAKFLEWTFIRVFLFVFFSLSFPSLLILPLPPSLQNLGSQEGRSKKIIFAARLQSLNNAHSSTPTPVFLPSREETQTMVRGKTRTKTPWWTFWIFFIIFFRLGEGEGRVRAEKKGGVGFSLKIPGRGGRGVSRRGAEPRDREDVWGNFWGGGG